MPSFWRLHIVDLVTIDISEETIIIFLGSVLRLLVTANIVPGSPILAALMMEAINSRETSVLTRSTRRRIPEDGILHSHRRENLKTYGFVVA
jgi:hypothetical protein